MSKYWGDGTTSSSDGMRMQLGVTSLHADSNPHYGLEKVLLFIDLQVTNFHLSIRK